MHSDQSGDRRYATAQKLASELLDKLSKAGPDRDTSPQLIASMTAKAYNSRGSATAQLGNTQAARVDFIAARDMAPRDPDSYVNLAVVSRLENKADEAVGFYENALSIDPLNFNALSGLMNLYVSQKQADKAIGRLDQVLATNPNNASMHFLKAQIYGSQQNVQGAETELSKTLEIDPNYIAARSSLGNFCEHQTARSRAG
jgi:Flp pilus assembly protein TadD